MVIYEEMEAQRQMEAGTSCGHGSRQTAFESRDKGLNQM